MLWSLRPPFSHVIVVPALTVTVSGLEHVIRRRDGHLGTAGLVDGVLGGDGLLLGRVAVRIVASAAAGTESQHGNGHERPCPPDSPTHELSFVGTVMASTSICIGTLSGVAGTAGAVVASGMFSWSPGSGVSR